METRDRSRHAINAKAPPDRAPLAGRRDLYWLRLPATGLCFLVFGIATLLLGLVVLPVARSVCFDDARGRQRAREIVGAGLRWFLRFARLIGVLRYSLHGFEKLGHPGQVIVANHPTLIDMAFLLGFVPRANCIVKTALFVHPVTRSAVIAAGYIPNAPADEMIHRAEQSLRDGQCLVIFPEGTRTVHGEPMRLLRGAANVALRAAMNLTPVFISCDPPMLSKKDPWYRIPARRAHFTIRVGDDIELAVLRAAPLPGASRLLNSRVTELFIEATKMRDSLA